MDRRLCLASDFDFVGNSLGWHFDSGKIVSYWTFKLYLLSFPANFDLVVRRSFGYERAALNAGECWIQWIKQNLNIHFIIWHQTAWWYSWELRVQYYYCNVQYVNVIGADMLLFVELNAFHSLKWENKR